MGPESPLILIVDDEKPYRLVLRAVLRRCGYRTVTAIDGEEAWAIARHLRPDAVLLDLAMPHVDGIRFLRQLRGEQSLRDTPVLVLTALSGSSAITEAERLGARHVLLKAHFSLVDLVARVAALLPASDAA